METIYKNEKTDLIRDTINLGQEVRNAQVTTNDLTNIELNNFFIDGKITIISTFPSVETPNCCNQIKTLSQKYNNNEHIILVHISEDLPFAQRRWMSVNQLENINILSDYTRHDFGLTYGLLMEKTHLLNRSVTIIYGGLVRYVEIKADNSIPLDFDRLDFEVNELLKSK